MKVIVDDLAVNYELKGKGDRLILMLHGWGDSLTSFHDLVIDLMPENMVVALDLPGFGATEAPHEVWDLDNYSSFVADFLAKLKLKPDVVMGHSNGGALAIRAISLGKINPNKLVLLASSGIRDGQKGKRAITKAVAKAGKATTFWLPEQKKNNLRQKLYGTIGSDMLVVPRLQETFKRTVRQDVQADAKKLNLPTLLVFADKDPAIPISDAHKYNELIKGSILEVLKSDNHFIHQDQPGKIAALIQEFIS